MKLPIYEKRNVVKTYETENYDLQFGTVEDVMTLFNVDKLKTGSDIELIKIVGEALPKCIQTVKPLMKDIFEGLTDDELKNAKMKDIINIIVEVIKYAFSQISLGVDSKN